MFVKVTIQCFHIERIFNFLGRSCDDITAYKVPEDSGCFRSA